jgi:hypothetical protein
MNKYLGQHYRNMLNAWGLARGHVKGLKYNHQ